MNISQLFGQAPTMIKEQIYAVISCTKWCAPIIHMRFSTFQNQSKVMEMSTKPPTIGWTTLVDWFLSQKCKYDTFHLLGTLW